jgi:hypothetical protein
VEEAILNAPLRFLLLILAWQMPQHWFYKTINSDQFFYPQTPILAIHKYQRLWKGKRWRNG